MSNAINKSFVLYHRYSSGSGKPDMIYIGSDKAKALDALLEFGEKGYFDSNSLYLECGNE